MPRPGGGLPCFAPLSRLFSQFAPPRRGSTGRGDRIHYEDQVCPAQAGVYHGSTEGRSSKMSLPRPGGGLPLYSVMDGGSQGFAPPRRGSTCISLTIVTMSNVCPAQAGVYLQGLWLSPGIPRLPRPGGGLPLSELSLFWISAFAPPRRGSTVGAHGDGATIIVCPAQAGVYRLSVGVSIGICGLPRPGGGLPLSELSLFWISAFAPPRRGSTLHGCCSGSLRCWEFAPPRRGSTVHSAVPSRGRGVCPAQAGGTLG